MSLFDLDGKVAVVTGSSRGIGRAIVDAFKKLDPRQLIRNPVMFTTGVVALLLTVLMVAGQWQASLGFQIQLVFWLWLTVLFGNFAEALAEGRSKAQADSLRGTKAQLTAKLLRGDRTEDVAASQLRAGEIVLTSMDADGTKAGYDLPMTRAVSAAVRIPVVASGGAGWPEQLFQVLTEGGADAALAASIFHYNEYGIAATKAYLAERGVPVRIVSRP